MLLRRLGNKSKIAAKIIEYFPAHETYIEFFFGAGGMFFHKQKVKYNFLNDNDEDVYNLFNVLKDNYDEFLEKLSFTPQHEKILRDAMKRHSEKDNVWRAVYFIVISNYALFGRPPCLKLGEMNHKKQALLNAKKTKDFLSELSVQFTCCDFRKVLSKISLRNPDRAFIYCDPPYLATGNNYFQGFKENDAEDLFKILVDSKIRFAVSEFDNPFILKLAERYGLHVHTICDRVNIRNRRTEILITNYERTLTLF